MKIRGVISNGLDLDKYYPGHEQYSKGFSRRSALRNANAGGTVIFKPCNWKSTQ